MQVRELLVPVKIVIEGDVTVKSIDRAVRQAWQRFSSLAWQEAVRAIGAAAQRQNRGALRTKGYEKRTLWTSAGFVEFKRRRFFYADGREEESMLVFDMRVNLGIAYDDKEKVGKNRAARHEQAGGLALWRPGRR